MEKGLVGYWKWFSEFVKSKDSKKTYPFGNGYTGRQTEHASCDLYSLMLHPQYVMLLDKKTVLM